jgi:hypothetical protein
MTKYSGKQIGRMLKVNLRMGALLREGRIEIGLKPRHISRLFSVPVSDVLRWESGFGTLPAALFGTLAEYFSNEVQWKIQLLMTAFQRERRALNHVEDDSNVWVINFDAIGVASGFLGAA